MGNVAAATAEPALSEEDELIPLCGDVSVRAFAAKLAAAPANSVVVVCGAGISVSAGIPDFRTPGSGIYDNLQKYNLPTPESLFDLEYFQTNPLPFFQFGKEMYPGSYQPTQTHVFIKMLQDKGLLGRCFTQNIDMLERQAGIDAKLLVEAHGTFASAHCLGCHAAHDSNWLREEILADRIPVRCPRCNGLVKPDIVFFGEGLPRRFNMLRRVDLPDAKLLLVLGTSLSVQPFASIVNEVSPLCPRLLVNNQRVGLRGAGRAGFRLDEYDNYRDVALIGACDEGVHALAAAAGWSAEFHDAVAAQGHATAQVPEKFGERAISRSWRRILDGALPALQPLLSERDAGDDETLGSACIRLRAARVVKEAGRDADSKAARNVVVSGGETLELAVRLPEEWRLANAGDTPSSAPWIGLVPSGSLVPRTVLGRVTLKSASEQYGDVHVPLIVPPLKEKQIRQEEKTDYEVWLGMELAGGDNDPKGLVAFRAGPITRAARNEEGVAIANNFARLAVRSACSSASREHQSTKDAHPSCRETGSKIQDNAEDVSNTDGAPQADNNQS